MAKKRKAFRFRIPWFSAPLPVTRPKDESKVHEQADTTIPIQGPPTKALPQSTPLQAQEIPIADPQHHSPSHSLQQEKPLALTSHSLGPSQSKSEPLASLSSFPAPRPPSPAHLALERNNEESRPFAIESTSLATSPSQQEEEKMAVFDQQKPKPEMSPLKTIPKSQELTLPKFSPHVSEPIPNLKESPFRTIPKSQDLTRPETSSQVSEVVQQPKTPSHGFESMPQTKESPVKMIQKSQEVTQLETSPRALEPVPEVKDSPLKSISKSQELTQLESSPIASQPLTQPNDSSLKSIPSSQELIQQESSSLVSEPKSQSKKSPLAPILKSQELTQLETSSHVSEPVPHLKESPLETNSKPKELAHSEISSHEYVPKPQVKESPLKTSTKHKELLQPVTAIHELKTEHPTTGRTKTKLHAKASTSGTQTTDPSSKVIGTKRKRKDAQESKVMSASTSTEKGTKVLCSMLPITKNLSSPSHQKDGSPHGEKTPLKEGIKEDVSKFVLKLAMGQPADLMEDKPVNAITLAGENRGATMQMGSELTKKEGSVYINVAYRTHPQDCPEVTTESDREEGSNNMVEPDKVGKAYVNSNIQSINNSLMYHGSVTEKDPVVQLFLPQKPTESIKSGGED